MKPAVSSTAASDTPEPAARSYGLASVGLAAALVIWLSQSKPQPFATHDVLAVHLLAAVPLAVLLAAMAARHWKLTACRALGGLLLLVSAGLIWVAVGEREIGWERSHGIFGFAFRTALALSLVTGAALGAAPLLSRVLPTNSELLQSGKWTIVLGAIVLPAGTFTYEAARCQHDRTRLLEYLEQSRLGDARTIAQRWLTLQPDALLHGTPFRGKPLAEVSNELRQAIDELALRVDRLLPPGATSADKIARARDLAMLGRNSAAVDVLSTVPDLTTSAPACNLAGTIAETEESWEDAAHWYRRAREICQSDVATSGPSPDLARATMGLAFSQRKQGDFAAAEQTYLQLLSLSPTADTYFLLATFYEDTQQVTKAKSCARKAMALAPDQYQVAGERLIDKLITLHFGCLQAYGATDQSP